MTIGAGLVLIAIGAIFRYAVEFDIVGLDIHTVGNILMLAGVVGLTIGLIRLAAGRSRTTVVEERGGPPPRDPRRDDYRGGGNRVYREREHERL